MCMLSTDCAVRLTGSILGAHGQAAQMSYGMFLGLEILKLYQQHWPPTTSIKPYMLSHYGSYRHTDSTVHSSLSNPKRPDTQVLGIYPKP